jgi:hypothetical protein
LEGDSAQAGVAICCDFRGHLDKRGPGHTFETGEREQKKTNCWTPVFLVL